MSFVGNNCKPENPVFSKASWRWQNSRVLQGGLPSNPVPLLLEPHMGHHTAHPAAFAGYHTGRDREIGVIAESSLNPAPEFDNRVISSAPGGGLLRGRELAAAAALAAADERHLGCHDSQKLDVGVERQTCHIDDGFRHMANVEGWFVWL